MADNVVTPGLGVTYATDEIGGVHVQRVKIQTGADGSANDVSTSNPVPVGGEVAHGDTDAGNPQKIGFKAQTAFPTAVNASERVDGLGDVYGRQLITHKFPGMQKSFAYNTTSQQTGTVIWDVTAGKRIVVTSLTISLYGTTGGRVIVWFGAESGPDTTYTAGTDQPLEIMSGVPSATVKSGLTKVYFDPVFCQNTDYALRVTTDAAVSVDIVVHGYEID